MLGVVPSELVLDSNVLFDRIPEEDAVELRAGVIHAFATMGQWHQEFRLRVAAQVRWFECRAQVHRSVAGTLFGYGYLVDITERKSAELKGTGLSARFKRAFEVAPQPMGITDKLGHMVALNEVFVRTLGYSAEEVPTLDMFLRRVFPDDDYRERLLREWFDAGKRSVQAGVPQSRSWRATGTRMGRNTQWRCERPGRPAKPS